MGIKEKFVEATKVDSKTVYITLKKFGIFRRDKKIKFIIKPIIPEDFHTEELRDLMLKERANGQSKEDVIRIATESFKQKFFSKNNWDTLCLQILQAGVLYPKVINGSKTPGEDELPYDLLKEHWAIRNELIEKIAEISPIFQGKLNG